jgi:hypothetical protein
MIIDGFLPSSQQLVGIYDNTNFGILFDAAICTGLKAHDNSSVMSHPLENGSKVSDHQVFDLIKISMVLNLSKKDYNLVFENIDTAYRSSTLLTIQTKVNIYKDMLIEAKPHEEGNYQGVIMNLSLKQGSDVSDVVVYNPQFEADSNTIKKGLQSGTEVSGTQSTTTLQNVSQSIIGFLS